MKTLEECKRALDQIDGTLTEIRANSTHNSDMCTRIAAILPHQIEILKIMARLEQAMISANPAGSVPNRWDKIE